MTIRETDLYEPVKRYLEHQGYTVNAEVAGCDVTARKDDELVLIELKTSFSTALLSSRSLVARPDRAAARVPSPRGAIETRQSGGHANACAPPW